MRSAPKEKKSSMPAQILEVRTGRQQTHQSHLMCMGIERGEWLKKLKLEWIDKAY